MRNKPYQPAPTKRSSPVQTPHPSAPPAPPTPPPETPVTRYIHPIQANPLFQDGPPLPSDPLVIILNTLTRHTEMLEELLRHMENNNTDTM